MCSEEVKSRSNSIVPIEENKAWLKQYGMQTVNKYVVI